MNFCERLPDYSRVENALAFKEIDRIPNFEVCVSRKVREALFGGELPDGLQSELFYRPKLGYDYIFLVPPYWKPPVYSRQTLHASDREWVDQHSSMITDWASFKAYDLYPEPVKPLNLEELRRAIAESRRHPGRLGVGALLPSCPFTEINLLMGYENFSLPYMKTSIFARPLLTNWAVSVWQRRSSWRMKTLILFSSATIWLIPAG